MFLCLCVFVIQVLKLINALLKFCEWPAEFLWMRSYALIVKLVRLYDQVAEILWIHCWGFIDCATIRLSLYFFIFMIQMLISLLCFYISIIHLLNFLNRPMLRIPSKTIGPVWFSAKRSCFTGNAAINRSSCQEICPFTRFSTCIGAPF